MKARPRKPTARGTAARKPAAPIRAAIARTSKSTSSPAKAARRTAAAKPANTENTAKASASSPARATLAPECTIEHAPVLQKQLVKILADRGPVTLDFSAVKRCDTAGMQVLAAFIRERRNAGGDVKLAGLSEHFLVTARLLGMAELFANREAGA